MIDSSVASLRSPESEAKDGRRQYSQRRPCCDGMPQPEFDRQHAQALHSFLRSRFHFRLKPGFGILDFIDGAAAMGFSGVNVSAFPPDFFTSAAPSPSRSEKFATGWNPTGC